MSTLARGVRYNHGSTAAASGGGPRERVDPLSLRCSAPRGAVYRLEVSRMTFDPPAAPDDEVAEAGGDDRFIFLDEAETWALWLPDSSDEGVVVHAHGAADDGAAELLFFECDAAPDARGESLVRCPDCGASIPEVEIDALIDALPDVLDA